MERKNIIVVKSLDFGVEIIKYCELLDASKKYDISKQLLRNGTSTGDNVFEAQHADGNADFIYKMKIAIKEANETLYWLEICERSETYPSSTNLRKQVEELLHIISKIIITTKARV